MVLQAGNYLAFIHSQLKNAKLNFFHFRLLAPLTDSTSHRAFVIKSRCDNAQQLFATDNFACANSTLWDFLLSQSQWSETDLALQSVIGYIKFYIQSYF